MCYDEPFYDNEISISRVDKRILMTSTLIFHLLSIQFFKGALIILAQDYHVLSKKNCSLVINPFFWIL